MSDQVWYEVDALTADLTSRRYRVLATSEEGAERKMRDRCPAAVAILVLEDRAALRLLLSRGMEVVAAAKVPLGAKVDVVAEREPQSPSTGRSRWTSLLKRSKP